MEHWRVIIPLLNKRVATYDEPVWHLAGQVSCQVIDDVDYGAIWRYLDDAEDDQYRSLISPRTTCVYIDYAQVPRSFRHEPPVRDAREQGVVVQAVFNLLSDSSPLLVSFAAILWVGEGGAQSDGPENVTVTTIIDLEPIANVHHLRAQPFGLKSSATLNRVNQIFNVVSAVSRKHPEVYVTLSRFNSSLMRTTESDRVIDITVSLESLIREKSELRFKFATYLSYVVQDNPADRLEAFGLLSTLYDARSSLVHGTPHEKGAQRALQEVSSRWDEVYRMARSAISYYMMYLFSESNGDTQVPWKEHLKRLTLGFDARIVD